MKKDNENKKKRINKRKVFRTVTALFFTLLTVLSIGIQVAAAFVAAGAIEGIVAMCVTIAVACGLMSQSEAETKAVRLPMDLTSEVYLYLLEEAADPLTPYKTSIAAIKAAGKIKEVTDGVNEFLNEHYGKTKTKEDKNFSGVSFASDFSDFIQSAQSHVKQVADGSIDMGGYGAVVHINYPKTFARRAWVFCDYIVVNAADISSVSSYIVYYKNESKTIWANGDVSTYSGSGSETYGVSEEERSYGISFYGDIRYTDGSKADDVVTSETKPASIGEVTDADGKPLTDAEGNPYVVNADGTVTVDGQDIPINEDGTVTINGDTYNVTYNLSNYDDTAVIDLLRRILGKIDNSYVADDNTLTDELPTTAPAAVTGEDLLGASSNAINFIPYDGLQSIFTTLETTTFVDKAPEDIVITLDTNFYKGSWVLIPASIIEEWSEALNVVKLLVSTVLLWVFAMWVRRLLFKNLFT